MPLSPASNADDLHMWTASPNRRITTLRRTFMTRHHVPPPTKPTNRNRLAPTRGMPELLAAITYRRDRSLTEEPASTPVTCNHHRGVLPLQHRLNGLAPLYQQNQARRSLLPPLIER